MTDPRDPIYRVIEMTDAGAEQKLTTGPYFGTTRVWTKKHRMYPRLQEARVYRDSLRKQGRDARILKFVFDEEQD